MSSSEQVIVVGAGPVGSITALRLSQLGVPVVLLESLPNTPTGHRAATTHSSTLDLLDKVGLSSQILEAGLKAQYFQYRNLNFVLTFSVRILHMPPIFSTMALIK